MEDVEIVHGDSEAVAFGMGTYGSRSLAVGGSAIIKSLEKVIEKGKKSQRTNSKQTLKT